MRNGKPYYPMSAVAASFAIAAILTVSSAAAAGKTFTWTTKSKEAAELAAQIVNQIETMSAGPQTLAQAQRVVELDPDFAFGHYLVATFSQGANQEAAQQATAKARELAQKASEGEREYMEAVFHVRANEFDKALPRLVALSEKYPDERMVWMMLGQVYQNQGNPAGARKSFERAVALDPKLPRVYAFLGNIHLLDDDYAKAREYYAKSVDMAPKGALPFNAVFGRVFSYLYEGNNEEAIKTLTAFRQDYEKAPASAQFPAVFIWNAMARIHLENGNPQLALTEYQKGYESVPGSNLPEDQKLTWQGRMHHGMGRALAKLGKHDEAWKQAETVKKMIEAGGEPAKQYWPAYHYLAGYLKLEAGDAKAAIEHLKQSTPTDEFHTLLLARAYEKAGDRENAMKTYKLVVDSKQIGLERALAYPEAKKKLKG